MLLLRMRGAASGDDMNLTNVSAALRCFDTASTPTAKSTSDAGSGEINAAAHHLALLDEIVDHVGIVRDQIRRRAGVDLSH